MLIIFLATRTLYSIKLSLKIVYLRKQSQYLYLIPNVLYFLSYCPNLHFILWIISEKPLTRFHNELAINLGLSINHKMQDIFFVIFSLFLSILVTSFSIVTVTVMYFSVFSPKQVNYFSNSSASSFMIKW